MSIFLATTPVCPQSDLFDNDENTQKTNKALVERLVSQSLEIESDPIIRAICGDAAPYRIERFIEAGVDLNQGGILQGLTPLIWSAIKGDTLLAKFLLEKGVDVNASDNKGMTALMASVYFRNENFARLLIERGANINQKNGNGWTSLMLAAHHFHESMVRFLLESNAELDLRNNSGETALMLACQREPNPESFPFSYLDQQDDLHINLKKIRQNRINIFEQGGTIYSLLKAGANPNLRRNDGSTAIFQAVENDFLSMVSLLLDFGAAHQIKRNDGKGLFDLSDDEYLHEMLRWHEIDLIFDKTTSAEAALAIANFIQEQSEPAEKNEYRKAALLRAAARGHNETIEMLLKMGVDVNSQSIYGYTALYLAADEGQTEVMLQLIKKGASVDLADSSGTTPLMNAIDENQFDAVKILIANNADINQKDKTDKTALMYAVDNNQPESVTLLLENQVDVNATDQNNQTALSLAVEENYPLIATLLIAGGIDFNTPPANHDSLIALAKSKRMQTLLTAFNLNEALWEAVADENHPAAKFLLDQGADLNITNEAGKTALMQAAANGNDKIVALLLDHGAQINASDKRGTTPLMTAVAQNNLETAALLIDRGAAINAQDSSGMTPLLQATIENNINMVRLLIDSGADLNISTHTGQTALMVAAFENSRSELLKLLFEKGAKLYVNNSSGKNVAVNPFDLIIQKRELPKKEEKKKPEEIMPYGDYEQLILTEVWVDTTNNEILIGFVVNQDDSIETTDVATVAIITTSNDTISTTRTITLREQTNPFQFTLPKPTDVADFIYWRLMIQFRKNEFLKKWIKPIGELMDPIILKLTSQDEYLAGSNGYFELQVSRKHFKKPYSDYPVEMTFFLSDNDSSGLKGKTNDYGIWCTNFFIPDSQRTSIRIKARTQWGTTTVELTKSFWVRQNIETTAKTFVTTDKALYQPGHTIHIRTLTLHAPQNKPAVDWVLPLRIFDPVGNCLFYQELKTNEFGIAAVDFQLADEVNLGEYSIHIRNEKRKTIKVNQYQLPHFNLTLKTDKDFYLPDETIQGELQANYFYGKPVAFCTTSIRIKSAGEVIELIRGLTNENGSFTFNHHITKTAPETALTIEAEITDKANHSDIAVISKQVVESALHLKIIPEFGRVVPGFSNSFYLIATTADNQPAQLNVEILTTKSNLSVQTNDFGFAQFRVEVPAVIQDSLLFTATGIDEMGNRITQRCHLTALKSDTMTSAPNQIYFSLNKQPLLIHTDDDYYCQGDTLQLTCRTAGDTTNLILDFLLDKYWIHSVVIPIFNRTGRAAFRLDERFSGLVTIRPRYVEPTGKDISDVCKYFYVVKDDALRINVSQDKPIYQPGAEATLTFKVSDANGNRTPAAISLNIVDQRAIKLFGGMKDSEIEFFKSSDKFKSLPFVLPGVTHQKLAHSIPETTPDGEAIRTSTKVAFTKLYEQEKLSPEYLSAEKIEKAFADYQDEIQAYYDYVDELTARRIFGAAQQFTQNNPRVKFDYLTTDLLAQLGYLEKGYAQNNFDSPYLVDPLFSNEQLVNVKISGLDANRRHYIDNETDDRESERYDYIDNEMDDRDLEWYDLEIELIDDSGYLEWNAPYLEADSQRFKIEVNSSLPAGILPLPPSAYATLNYGRAYCLKKTGQAPLPGTVLAGSIRMDYRHPEQPQPPIKIKLGKYHTKTDASGYFIFKNIKPGKYELILSVSKTKHLSEDFRNYLTTILPDTLKPIHLNLEQDLSLLIEFPGMCATAADTLKIGGQQNIAAFDDLKKIYIPRAKRAYADFTKFKRYSVPLRQKISTRRASRKTSIKTRTIERGAVSFSTRQKPRARENFPETLFWNPSIITDEKGEARVDLHLADSITDWNQYCSAVSRAGELGTNLTTLRVFQEFFIDVDLPLQLTQHDEISIPVAIYNYLDQNQTVELELETASWFELIDPPIQKIEIAPAEVKVAYFRIQVLDFGTFPVRINAYGNRLSDAIIKSVKIIPNGKKITNVINGKFYRNLKKTITITDGAISGSEQILVKIYPNQLSPVIEGLDNLLRIPYGCFEQTASITYPNIIVTRYLKITNQSNPDLEAKMQNYLEQGYQRLLAYELSPAGFEWFGQAPANLFLTAYGLMIFSEMSQVRYVDPEIIRRTRNILFRMQNENGSWHEPRPRRFVDTWTQIMSDTLKETAYVLWAMLQAEKFNVISSTGAEEYQLNKALGFLVTRLNQINDPYTLALCANAFSLAGGNFLYHVDGLLEKLLEKKQVAGNQIYWHAQSNSIVNSKGLVADLETTALAGYAFALAGKNHSILKGIISFLLNHRDEGGTWFSTQATTMAMKLLVATLRRSTQQRARLTVNFNERVSEKITIKSEDRFRVLTLDFKEKICSGNNEISLQYSDEDSLNFQIVTSYYQQWDVVSLPENKLNVVCEVENPQINPNEIMHTRLQISNPTENRLGMMIVRIDLPPYFDIFQADLQQLLTSGEIQRYERQGQQILLYLNRFKPYQTNSYQFNLKPQAPQTVQGFYAEVYEYYQPDNYNFSKPVLINVTR